MITRRTCPSWVLSEDQRERWHSFFQWSQSRVTLGGKSHHEAKLWFSHWSPNFNCSKCLHSCRHILSFFSLLSLNKSAESSVSSVEWVHGSDHRPHTHIQTHTQIQTHTLGYGKPSDFPLSLEELKCFSLNSNGYLDSFTKTFTAFPIHRQIRIYSSVRLAECSCDLHPHSQKPLQVSLITVYSLARPIRPPLCLQSQQSPAQL